MIFPILKVYRNSESGLKNLVKHKSLLPQEGSDSDLQIPGILESKSEKCHYMPHLLLWGHLLLAAVRAVGGGTFGLPQGGGSSDARGVSRAGFSWSG